MDSISFPRELYRKLSCGDLFRWHCCTSQWTPSNSARAMTYQWRYAHRSLSAHAWPTKDCNPASSTHTCTIFDTHVHLCLSLIRFHNPELLQDAKLRCCRTLRLIGVEEAIHWIWTFTYATACPLLWDMNWVHNQLVSSPLCRACHWSQRNFQKNCTIV